MRFFSKATSSSRALRVVETGERGAMPAVLILVTKLTTSNHGMHILAELKRMKAALGEAELIVMSAGGPMVSDAAALGVTHIHMSALANPRPGPIARIQLTRRIKRLVGDKAIELICAFEAAGAVRWSKIAAKADVPFVLDFDPLLDKSLTLVETKSQINDRPWREALGAADQIVCHSKAAASLARSRFGLQRDLDMVSKVIAIDDFDPHHLSARSLVRAAQMFGVQPDAKLMVVDARGDDGAAAATLIPALAQLDRQSISVLWALDDGRGGDVRQALGRELRAAQLENHVRLIELPEATATRRALWSLADIVAVWPAHALAMPATAVEAQAMGATILVPGNSAVQECIPDIEGHHAALDADDIDAWANHLSELLKTNDAPLLAGSTARAALAERFDVSESAEQLGRTLRRWTGRPLDPKADAAAEKAVEDAQKAGERNTALQRARAEQTARNLMATLASAGAMTHSVLPWQAADHDVQEDHEGAELPAAASLTNESEDAPAEINPHISIPVPEEA
ncbi:MAG: hypothetical protein AAGF15_06600, partial [Pseudomonadota bacterium]